MHKSVIIGGASGQLVEQLGAMANRHGLITGATGTGKTVTLQVLAEGFARLGTPVFVTDVKGDLSGLGAPGRPHKEVTRRLDAMPVPDYQQRGYPTLFWDVFGEQGHPVRTTISEMGPLLLSNLLELNDTQMGVLYAAFALADDEGLLLLDLADLRAMLTWIADHARDLRSAYGNVSAASVGAIQRRLLVLEEQGAERFFGEPALSIRDLMQRDFSGNGVISLLHSERLIRESPRLYAAFLMWLVSELFEELPEVGDPEVPQLVLFFDEAHLLFNGMPKPLLEKIEQVVRLIRSKGVGVYFVTQTPLDIPESVLGQLGLKVQHALRSFTPKDRKTIRAVAEGFPGGEESDFETTITSLGVGEALVSALDASGAPGAAQQTLIKPPESQIGPIPPEARMALIGRSPLSGRYDQEVDRESAHEMLEQRTRAAAEQAAQAQAAEQAAREAEKEKKASASRGRQRESAVEALFKSAARSVGRTLGNRLARGLLGSLLKQTGR
ncbi:MAG: helicase HerA-like domain-containing protein [Pseudomonadales bacterium]